jgi:hypothetical protein
MSDEIDTKYFEYLVFQHDPNRELILKALEIVRDFIVEKGLVITGGMAIDFALRLNGEKLYDDNVLPDYDFFSPEHHAHAYELGAILCKKLRDSNGKMPGISVIDALHITTMKVRINFIPVADITYMPYELFDELKTLEYNYNGKLVKFRHPHWQMIDQHRSLSYPYENSPKEVILSRLKKDMSRFDMLYKHYPIKGSVIENEQFQDLEFDLSLLENTCISGFAGMYLLMQKEPLLSGIKNIKGMPLVVLSDKQLQTVSKIMDKYKSAKITYYNAYLDLLPAKIVITISDNFENPIIESDNFEIHVYDMQYKMIAAEKYPNFYLADTQYTLGYFMSMYLLDKKNSEIYKNAYFTLAQLVESGEKKPLHFIYGSQNIGIEHLLQRIQTLSQFKEIPKIKIQMKPGRFYPTEEKNCQIPLALSSFQYEESPFYQIDGMQVSKQPVKIVEFMNPTTYESSDSENES